MIALLAGLTYGIIEAPHRGWFSAPILSVLLVAAAALVPCCSTSAAGPSR